MKIHNPKLVVGTAFLVLSLIIILAALNIRKQTLKPTKTATPEAKKNEANQEESFTGEVVAKAGEEELYKEDLEYELSFFPASPSAAVKGAVINKMLRDSIILQAASKEKLITLDDKVFNARNKNYRLRLRLVDLVKKEVNKKSASLEGKAVVIWFQNMTPGELGYEKGREVAFEKISGLQTLVKKGSLTIEKAIEAVQKDSSLIEIDSSYEANASIDFNLGLREPITIDPDVCHGKPVIRGLRYPVESVLEYLAAGDSIEDVLVDFPDLQREDLLACLEFATRSLQVRSQHLVLT